MTQPSLFFGDITLKIATLEGMELASLERKNAIEAKEEEIKAAWLKQLSNTSQEIVGHFYRRILHARFIGPTQNKFGRIVKTYQILGLRSNRTCVARIPVSFSKILIRAKNTRIRAKIPIFQGLKLDPEKWVVNHAATLTRKNMLEQREAREDFSARLKHHAQLDADTQYSAAMISRAEKMQCLEREIKALEEHIFHMPLTVSRYKDYGAYRIQQKARAIVKRELVELQENYENVRMSISPKSPMDYDASRSAKNYTSRDTNVAGPGAGKIAAPLKSRAARNLESGRQVEGGIFTQRPFKSNL